MHATPPRPSIPWALLAVAALALLTVGCAEDAMDPTLSQSALSPLPPIACDTVTLGDDTSCKSAKAWKKIADETCTAYGLEASDVAYGPSCAKKRFSTATVQCCEPGPSCTKEVVGSPKACRPAWAWEALATKKCAANDGVVGDFTPVWACDDGKFRRARYTCCEAPVPVCDDGTSWSDELGSCCPDAIFTAACACPEGSEVEMVEVFDENGCLLGTGCECTEPKCEDNTSWNEELDACCPDYEFIADCWCDPGVAVTWTEVFDDNGCFLGTTCACEEPKCEDDTSWNEELDACCPDYLFIADCWCPEGTEYQETEVFDDNGCLLGMGCECVEPKCDDDQIWDSEVGACCPPFQFISDCLCPDADVTWTEVFDENGCMLGIACECGGATCDEGSSWDPALEACCPDSFFIADCWCPDSTSYQEVEVFDENGCLLGIGCECVEPTQCVVGDTTYAVGDSFPADDGCNTCTCMEGGVAACTLMLCPTGCETDSDCPDGQACEVYPCFAPPCPGICLPVFPTVCEYAGETYAVGESFPDEDGCNTCFCGEDGAVGCTKMYCPTMCMGDDACEPGEMCNASEICLPPPGCEPGMICPAVCYGYCVPAPSTNCEYGGEKYEPGDSFDATDGCNSCTCMDDGTVACTEMACMCSPEDEWYREYVADSPMMCAVILFWCPENTTYFANDCGCGCEQSSDCPQWFNCMPGSGTPCNVEEIMTECPYSEIAW